MFKIGQFSQLSRVSVRMLRHYDEIGLLPPHCVDPSSGYRYYAADQLPRLNRILALKELGFGLEQVARLLDDGLSAAEIGGMLKLRRAEVERTIAAERERLLRIEQRLQIIEREDQPPFDGIVVRALAAQLVASIRAVVPKQGNDITTLFETLERTVAAYAARANRPPLLLLHDGAFREYTRDIEVVVPLLHTIPEGDGITVNQLPAVAHAACVVHSGDYASLDEVAGRLLRWVDTQPYTRCGPLRELYVRYGADEVGYSLPQAVLADSATQFVTELQLPLRRVS